MRISYLDNQGTHGSVGHHLSSGDKGSLSKALLTRVDKRKKIVSYACRTPTIQSGMTR